MSRVSKYKVETILRHETSDFLQQTDYLRSIKKMKNGVDFNSRQIDYFKP